MKSPKIEIVCIGTELLTDKVNTHTTGIGQALGSIGLSLDREQTVSDDPHVMGHVFRESWKSADVVISCGGLGPTFDDLTRDVWAKVLKTPLHFHSILVEEIREKFRSRRISMPPLNKRQGYVLRGAEVISNPNGTAPGQFFRQGKKLLFLLPGPSRELFPMLADFVLPVLKRYFPGRFIWRKSFHLVGIPESRVDHIIRPLVRRFSQLKGCRLVHGILASQSIITVKFTVEGTEPACVEETGEHVAGKFRRALGQALFGEDQDTLPGVIGRRLSEKNLTLAVAESCTGGLISKIMTDTPGSSDYFVQGAVTYSNASKVALTGVSSKTLARHGAVSEQVAREMAAGVRKKARADFGLSVTGIAGPTGGTPEKPVGLVYMAVSSKHRTTAHRFQFSGDREWVRHRSALMALDLLRKELGR